MSLKDESIGKLSGCNNYETLTWCHGYEAS